MSFGVYLPNIPQIWLLLPIYFVITLVQIVSISASAIHGLMDAPLYSSLPSIINSDHFRNVNHLMLLTCSKLSNFLPVEFEEEQILFNGSQGHELTSVYFSDIMQCYFFFTPQWPRM